MAKLYDIEVKTSGGTGQSLRDYEGKVILVVNTASKCGFTPQFKELQELHEKFKDQGLVVLGFPCDQFANQEFEHLDETLQFCQVNYGVTFPMFAKVDVKGEQASPLFKLLTEEKKGLLGSEVKWNFTKFLINRQGEVVDRYAPQTAPSKIAKDIEKLL
ncbi:MAG: glutathione peroxidase [Paenibacillus sp.]|uniref:Glutathione peroxidase n=1 Tax=Paenibacillus aquistagni TaxID=1852522 RepID=A0A1X7KCI9_9BACL|nr:glutathione peroxidase [Paenibacillus aquistagni]MBR2568514.1 glutathione peroxidase [Paenibacillus sp.]SMG38787.1 glutathione peroxidase [Paenibacillus aquistagni]